MIMFTSTVMKVGNSLVLVLPKPVVEGFGIEKGDTLRLAVTDKGIYISTAKAVETDERTAAVAWEVEKP